MKIATYNVNSVNARIENLCSWLQKEQPDIVLLQEIKCEFNAFPFFLNIHCLYPLWLERLRNLFVLMVAIFPMLLTAYSG